MPKISVGKRFAVSTQLPRRHQNGTVDAAVFTVWRDSLGQIDDRLAADGNDDGFVNSLGYEVWQLHFGEKAGGGAGGLSTGSGAAKSLIPEPAPVAVLAVLTLFVLPRRRAIFR